MKNTVKINEACRLVKKGEIGERNVQNSDRKQF